MCIRDRSWTRSYPAWLGSILAAAWTVEIREREIDFEKLDVLIRKEIPYGREVRDDLHELNDEIDLTQLRCADQVNLNRAMRSIGSLGGGNHFIEVDRAEDGRLFLVVHSGSRHLGCLLYTSRCV